MSRVTVPSSRVGLRSGSHGKAGAAIALGLVVVLSLALLPGAAFARIEARRAADSATPPDFGSASRFVNFLQNFHNVGSLWLAVSNLGIFGNLDQGGNVPSAEWLPNTQCEYLYSAGLWIGGLYDRCEPLANFPVRPDTFFYCGTDTTQILITDTLVTTGQYSLEYFPDLFLPSETLYEAFEGRPGGNRGEDDDGDGSVDEDALNGRNDDPLNDGRIDEDYAAISQQMFTGVYRDTSTFRNDRIQNPLERNYPIGLELNQDSYQYTAPAFDDFVGVEFRIKNIGLTQRGEHLYKNIRQVFIGFFVDSDVGCTHGDQNLARHLDDRAGFIALDTVLTFPGAPSETLSINVGYMRDEPAGDDGSDAKGWFGTMFLGHTIDSTGELAPEEVKILAYKSWANGEEDPKYDGDAYRLLCASQPGGSSGFDQVIDVGSQRSDDWRQLLSAGPFASLPPESTLIFQSAFVIGEGREGLITNALAAQRIYNRPVEGIAQKIGNRKISSVARAQLNHWSGTSAPPPPGQRLVPGDHRVTIEWDNFSERSRDVLTGKDDFAGYQIWKAVGWRREAAGPRDEQWFVIADIARDEVAQFNTGLEGIGRYHLVDTEVKNGYPYWYAVTAYDSGDPASGIPPIYGKFSQSSALVYPKWNPRNSLGDDLTLPNETLPGTGAPAGQFTTLDNVHVVPNPYKENADWDLAAGAGDPTGRRIYFINLPPRATIRIFSLTGDLLQTIGHEWRAANADPTAPDAGTYWNLVTRNNQEVESGIYIYQIDSDVGTKVGKFAIIR